MYTTRHVHNSACTACTQLSVYTTRRVHNSACTQRSMYTTRRVHNSACTQLSMYTTQHVHVAISSGAFHQTQRQQNPLPSVTNNSSSTKRKKKAFAIYSGGHERDRYAALWIIFQCPYSIHNQIVPRILTPMPFLFKLSCLGGMAGWCLGSGLVGLVGGAGWGWGAGVEVGWIVGALLRETLTTCGFL